MNHLPGNFRWSFSKLASFIQCPMSFYLTYVKEEREDEIPNFFSLYGSFCHKLLEDWALNRCPSFALAEAYESGYEEAVTMPPPPFPKGYGEKAYQAGLNYFQSFNGFGEEWEVLSAEKKFVIRIDQYDVSGIADLVLRNRDTGEIWVIDHKSKSWNSMKKELNLYRRQLYLYAIWCKEEFGQYPAKISFNMFKEGKWIDEAFSFEALSETERWFVDTIREIETCDIFEMWSYHMSVEASKLDYFCGQICGVALNCENYHLVRQREIEAWREKKQMEEMFYG